MIKVNHIILCTIGILCIFFIPIAKPGVIWLGILTDSYFGKNPPTPEVTYGEFPFRLEYALADEVKVVEDTVICEFVGFERRGEAGKARKWKSYLKSGNKRLTLLRTDNMELYFSYGTAEFYMGDNNYNDPSVMPYNPNVIDYIAMENGHERYSAILATEAWEKYGLKILNWKYSPPIQNSFK